MKIKNILHVKAKGWVEPDIFLPIAFKGLFGPFLPISVEWAERDQFQTIPQSVQMAFISKESGVTDV